MIKIYSLNNYIKREMAYGGHDCSKKAIIFNNENWFIKYPRINHQSSVEEYLGSMIYQSIGLLTQEVK